MEALEGLHSPRLIALQKSLTQESETQYFWQEKPRAYHLLSKVAMINSWLLCSDVISKLANKISSPLAWAES
jgi:hypothetical protein